MSQNFFERYGGSGPENYERHFVPAIGAPLAAKLVEHVAAVRPGEHVLDVACGTGIVARLAAERVGPAGSVIGVDINGEMLELARSVTPAGRKIEWHQSSAEALPLPDQRFDVVLCQLGLQFFSDRLSGLRQMHRVLTPTGRMALSVVGPTPPLFAILEEALARHSSDPAAAQFIHLVFSLNDGDELRALLDLAGFHEVTIRREPEALRLAPPREFLWQYVRSTPLAGAIAGMDQDSREALEREVVTRWQPFVDRGSLVFQAPMVITTARS